MLPVPPPSKTGNASIISPRCPSVKSRIKRVHSVSKLAASVGNSISERRLRSRALAVRDLVVSCFVRNGRPEELLGAATEGEPRGRSSHASASGVTRLRRKGKHRQAKPDAMLQGETTPPN